MKLINMLCLLLFTSTSIALAGGDVKIFNYNDQLDDLNHSVVRLLKEKDFVRLDQMADEFREKKLHFQAEKKSSGSFIWHLICPY